MKIRPIETKFRGRRFRSRREARWAVFFSNIGTSWDYEPEGFELPSGRYLPDFLLPKFNCWFEVKGTCPTVLELRLACELAEATDMHVGVFSSSFYRDPQGMWTARGHLCMGIHADDSSAIIDHAEWLLCWECYRCQMTPYGDSSIMLCKDWGGPRSKAEGRTCGPNQRNGKEGFQRAYEAALSARFEFGEEG